MGDHGKGKFTRREAIAAGVVGAATVAAVSAVAPSPSPSASAKSGEGKTVMSNSRMPVAFLPHGGGPWPFVDMGWDDPPGFDALAGYLKSVAKLPSTTPRALLVVSAHWEEAVPTVMSGERPPMYFDYYGFPPESYQLTWPAPGDPKLAARVRELLGAAGFQTAEDSRRGFDHGTFVPLKVTYPEAQIPVVQLSLKAGLDPAEHLKMGRALAPLRDEGVFIVGSGMTFHNLRAFMDPRSRPIAETFDAWLREAACKEPAERDRALQAWTQAPAARLAHPREEHLIPLMVVAGSAGSDKGTVPYNGTFMGLRLSAYHFA